LLRRHRAPVPGHELAQKLEISMRTLYRDIATLQSQGAEIGGEPGLGYVLRPGFTLPPLMLTVDEIEALALGSRWVAVRGDERLAAAAEHALHKIRSVLPLDLRETVDAATLTVPPASTVPPAAVDVSAIRGAIRAEHKLTITYRDNDGRQSRRTVWPLLLGFFDQALMLAAWCELRQDYRSFRVDRVLTLESTRESYPRRRALMVKEWRQTLGAHTTARN
jgi:predicted DNA-binding transcriptional regulator YafY